MAGLIFLSWALSANTEIPTVAVVVVVAVVGKPHS
jgi:hypothetical protein